MIEKKFVKENVLEFQIQEYITNTLKNVGHSSTKIKRTPLGEKIIVSAARPGLVVGKKGENIKKLTVTLKKKFRLENPQIEIAEVENVLLDAQIIAERIASTLEKYGIQRFKSVGHKTLQDVMNAGARGIEIIISGKVPSARAKRWRFYQGYLKKSGEFAITGVRKAYASAQLKSGTVGIQVRIMPPNIILPDDVSIKSDEEVEASLVDAKKEEDEKNAKKTRTKRHTSTNEKSQRKSDGSKKAGVEAEKNKVSDEVKPEADGEK